MIKLLLDTCVWGGSLQPLIRAGHDVIWAGDWETDPGDEEILQLAYAQGRVLVTLDKDFGELAVVYRKAHCGIIRLSGIAAQAQAQYCLHLLEKYSNELQAGAIVTATENRVRIRQAVP